MVKVTSLFIKVKVHLGLAFVVSSEKNVGFKGIYITILLIKAITTGLVIYSQLSVKLCVALYI